MAYPDHESIQIDMKLRLEGWKAVAVRPWRSYSLTDSTRWLVQCVQLARKSPETADAQTCSEILITMIPCNMCSHEDV